MTTIQEQFQAAIARLTEPLNGQYPRPWMTELADPLSANVLIVGKNEAKGRRGPPPLSHAAPRRAV